MDNIYKYLKGVSYRYTGDNRCHGCPFDVDESCHIMVLARALTLQPPPDSIGCIKGILELKNGSTYNINDDDDIIMVLKMVEVHD